MTAEIIERNKNINRDRNIFIKTFDGFDVYVDGGMVLFSGGRSREMLAVMVSARGSSVSLDRMAGMLYGELEETAAKNNLRVVYHRLRRSLMEYGIEGILIKKRGSYAVDTELFVCDLYEFLKGNPDYVALYSGRCMPGYRWSGDMLPYLERLHRKYNGVLE